MVNHKRTDEIGDAWAWGWKLGAAVLALLIAAAPGTVAYWKAPAAGETEMVRGEAEMAAHAAQVAMARTDMAYSLLRERVAAHEAQITGLSRQIDVLMQSILEQRLLTKARRVSMGGGAPATVRGQSAMAEEAQADIDEAMEVYQREETASKSDLPMSLDEVD
jgi:hypothetical protein